MGGGVVGSTVLFQFHESRFLAYLSYGISQIDLQIIKVARNYPHKTLGIYVEYVEIVWQFVFSEELDGVNKMRKSQVASLVLKCSCSSLLGTNGVG